MAVRVFWMRCRARASRAFKVQWSGVEFQVASPVWWRGVARQRFDLSGALNKFIRIQS